MTDDLDLLAPFVEAALAKKSFLDFCKLLYPGFQDPPHIRLMATELERVEAGEVRRLIISMPPRHSKSTMASQLFPAWFLGRNPRSDAIVATHSATLSQEFSRKSRALLVDDKWPFETRLSETSSAVDRWHTTDDGGLLAVGVQGSVTGRGGHLIVLDDLLHDSGTETEREAAWKWFHEVLIPRLEPGGRIVLLATRQHDEDPIGRVLSGPDADRWRNITLPAIAEENDPLGREPGAALWPERVTLEQLNEFRVSMGDRAFNCQFQQRPAAEAGILFKRDWLSTTFRPNEAVHGQLAKVLAVDGAWRTGPSNDYSALTVWASNGIEFFLLDAVRGRWEYPDLRRRVAEMAVMHRVIAALIESAASGLALIQELKRTISVPVIEVVPRGSKESRIDSILPIFEAGKVRLPEGAPWLDEWVDEHLRFPNGRHDDFVDTTFLALDRLRDMIARSQRAQSLPINWMAR